MYHAAREVWDKTQAQYIQEKLFFKFTSGPNFTLSLKVNDTLTNILSVVPLYNSTQTGKYAWVCVFAVS